MQREQAPVLLPTRMVEKPWGMDRLPPPFPDTAGMRIGEIWFEPPAELPQILVKYLFVQEKLSVQVHPSDAQARRAGLGGNGKDECWIVMAAEPSARLGIGFRQAVDAATMRAAALDGSIEHMLDWQPARPGDVRYLPAGTVHAVGGGLCILEIQQNSDVSYRLYDYGRPRALHIDRAVAIAGGEPHDPAHRFHRPAGSASLVDGPAFAMDQWAGPASHTVRKPALILPLNGTISIAGQPVEAGQCALAQAGSDVVIPGDACGLICRPAESGPSAKKVGAVSVPMA